MTLILNLPPELEAELATEAARLGIPLPEYAMQLLSEGRLAGSSPRDGAELVAYWQEAGIIGSRADIADSSAHARQLRAQAQHRERP